MNYTIYVELNNCFLYRTGFYPFNAYPINEDEIAEHWKKTKWKREKTWDLSLLMLKNVCILKYKPNCTTLILINDLDHLE